jgi:hypothetical protein
MSGGSFNYLHNASPYELDDRTQDLADMSKALEELGYKNLSREFRKFLVEMGKMIEKKEKFLSKYGKLMKAVEWYYSADWSFEDVQKEAEKLGYSLTKK